MAFRPEFARDRIIAVLVLLALVALTLGLASQMLTAQPVGPKTVVFLALLLPVAGLALLLGFRVWQLFGLDYWLDRDALRIHWMGDLITVPLGLITDIGPVAAAQPPVEPPRAPDAKANWQYTLTPNWRRWPLIWIRPRQSQSEEEEQLAVYATRPPADCLAVEADGFTYLISPRDPAAFLAAFRTRQDFGALRELPEQIETAAIHEHWLWRDRLAQFLLVASLGMGLVLLCYFLWLYPTLPEQTPLHFDARGLVDRVGPRRALMLLPAITLLMCFFNIVMGFAFYERRRLATYLLWGNALAVQIAGLLIGRNLFQLVI